MKDTNGSRGLLAFAAIAFVLIFSSTSFADTGRYLSDEANRLRWIEYGTGKVVQYIYDGEGNLLQRLAADPPPVDVSVSTAWDDFGTKASGSGAITHSIAIYNDASPSLNIGTITLSGTTNNFVVQNDNCSNQVVAVSASCTFEVKFTPQSQVASGFYINVPSNKPAFSVLAGGETVASLPTKVVMINNDDDYTASGSVTLSLSAPSYPANISEMCVSNTATCSSWGAYSAQTAWGLTSGDGVKAVYVKFRNSAGTTSPSYFDTIYLETGAPTGSIVLNGNAPYTGSTLVTMGLSGSDQASGTTQMRFSSDGVNWSAWEAYEISKSHTLAVGNGVKTVYVQYRDQAGNTSTTYSSTITLVSPDILWRNTYTGENTVWYMNGATYNGSASLMAVSDQNWKIVGVGDFNIDGKPDILWRNSSTGENTVWYMNGATYNGSASLMAVSDQNWKIVGVGDFNIDGKPDILWRNSSTGENYVWYMNGATYNGNAQIMTVSDPNWQIAGVGDFNNDGSPDILWRNSSTGENYVWYMNGATFLGSAAIMTVSDPNWKIMGTGDFTF